MGVKKDPVCGMDVDEEEARKKGLKINKNGKDYFFCSNNCKEKFGKKEPWYRSQTFGKVFPLVLAVVLLGGGLFGLTLESSWFCIWGFFLFYSP